MGASKNKYGLLRAQLKSTSTRSAVNVGIIAVVGRVAVGRGDTLSTGVRALSRVILDCQLMLEI